MTRYEQGVRVSYDRLKDDGTRETIFGKIDSAPTDGLWITWDTDFEWAHKNLFNPIQSLVYRDLKVIEDDTEV